MNFLIYAMLCLIWGSTWAAIKIGLENSPPLWDVSFRFIISASLLLLYNLIRKVKYPKGWRNLWKVAWPGLLTYFGSYTCVYIGSQYVPSGVASVIFALFPFFTMLMMPAFFKSEKVTLWKWIGAGIGFAGVATMFIEPLQFGGKELFGMGILILGPLASSIGTIYVKAKLHDEEVLPVLALQILVGAIVTTVFALVFEDLDRFHVTVSSMTALFYLAIFGTIITFSSYYWLLKRMPLLTMAMIAFICPMLSIFLGYFVLHEVLTLQDYFGSGLVLIGVLIVNLSRK